MSEELVETYIKKFWETLERNKEELEKMLARLYYVKGVPSERSQELTTVLYIVCAGKFCNYDDNKSAFTTWMIQWARALLTNYYRNSGGKRSPLASDLLESDLKQFDNGDTAYDNVGGGLHGESLDTALVLEEVLAQYSENVRDFDTYSAVFDTLLLCGFDVSARVIAYEVEMSPQMAWEIRSQILSELAFMLKVRGVDNPFRRR